MSQEEAELVHETGHLTFGGLSYKRGNIYLQFCVSHGMTSVISLESFMLLY